GPAALSAARVGVALDRIGERSAARPEFDPAGEKAGPLVRGRLGSDDRLIESDLFAFAQPLDDRDLEVIAHSELHFARLVAGCGLNPDKRFPVSRFHGRPRY